MTKSHFKTAIYHGMNLMLAVAMAVMFTACKTQTMNQTATYQPQPENKPIQMILDSDFGSSTDDLFALMMSHHYIDEGKVDLKGVVVDREGEKNAELVDIFRGFPLIPPSRIINTPHPGKNKKGPH